MSDKEKGSITFKYITHSKCPYCGAGISIYRKWKENDFKEEVRFYCGLGINSETPTHFKEWFACKNTKEYKKLKKERIKQREIIVEQINKLVDDEKLKKEMLDKMDNVKYRIEDW